MSLRLLIYGCLAFSLRAQTQFAVVRTTGSIAGSAFGAVDQLAQFSVLGDRIKFKVDRVETTGETPNFLIVSPPSGTAPTMLTVALNPNVTRTMRPGNYVAGVRLVTVDQSPPATASFLIRLTLRRDPQGVINAVVDAASQQPAVSPGGMVTISGTALGPPLKAVEYDGGGLFPRTVAGTTVTFNGEPAPLLYVTPAKITAIAPFSLTGSSAAEVVVTYFSLSSKPFSVPVVESAPAVLSSTPDGATLGAPLNYRFKDIYSANSADNPAEPGSVVVLFATGAGKWNPSAFSEASISLMATLTPLEKPVSLKIGGLPAQLFYVGAAPFQSVSMLQINAFVPEGAGSGPQPVLFTIGGVESSGQLGTIFVK